MPLELAKRYAVAKVVKEEVDNQVKLLKARQDYELAQAEIRKMDSDAEGKHAKDVSEAKVQAAQARRLAADARIRELIARRLEAKGKNPAEVQQWVESVIQQIAMKGGRVELEPPELSPPDVLSRGEEKPRRQLPGPSAG